MKSKYEDLLNIYLINNVNNYNYIIINNYIIRYYLHCVPYLYKITNIN